MAGMEKAIGRCKSADAGSDYLMRGWSTDGKSSVLFFVFTISTFYSIECFVQVVFQGGWKIHKKVAKGACNFQKTVYSMSSFQ